MCVDVYVGLEHMHSTLHLKLFPKLLGQARLPRSGTRSRKDLDRGLFLTGIAGFHGTLPDTHEILNLSPARVVEAIPV